jgi:hypothetical protein
MPSSTLDDLVEAYSRVSAANRTILDRFRTVAQLFHQQGIPFLLLKGADVISRLYGIRGTRPLSDVDLLVLDSDLPAIDRLLTGRGFERQIDGNPSYVSADRGLSLDLVTSLWYLTDQELTEVWSRAVARPFPPTPVTCLSTEDLLLYLIAYAVSHRGQISSANLQDWRLLIGKESPDWRTVLHRADQYGLRTPLYHALSRLAAGAAELVPDDVLAQVSPRTRRDAIQAWALRKLVTHEPLPEVGHLFLILTQRRMALWSWISRTLLPSRTFLSYRYGARAQVRPWTTRFLRLFQLIVAASALSARIMRRLCRIDRRTATTLTPLRNLRRAALSFSAAELPEDLHRPVLQSLVSPLVSSQSMAPTLLPGDRLELAAPDNLEIGDIILFRKSGRLICHRITGITDSAVDTTGDAVEGSSETIISSDIVGLVTAVLRNGRRLSVTSRPKGSLQQTRATRQTDLRTKTWEWSRGCVRALLRSALGLPVIGGVLRHLALHVLTIEVLEESPVRCVPSYLSRRNFPLSRIAALQAYLATARPDLARITLVIRAGPWFCGMCRLVPWSVECRPAAEGLDLPIHLASLQPMRSPGEPQCRSSHL